MGAMTGRGVGLCAGSPVPGSMNPGGGWGAWGRGGRWGCGLGRGFRGGRGWGAMPYPTPAATARFTAPTPEQERTILQGQLARIEDALSGIRERLHELDPAESQNQ